MRTKLFRDAVAKTGKKRLIVGGLNTEICLAFAMTEALRADYGVMFVSDAVGGGLQGAHCTTIEHAGAVSTNFEEARLMLVSFKNQGIHIGLDDFGAGYSSLRHLRELPLDVLKVDKCFVHSMMESDEAHTIVKTIMILARIVSDAEIGESESACQFCNISSSA